MNVPPQPNYRMKLTRLGRRFSKSPVTRPSTRSLARASLGLQLIRGRYSARSSRLTLYPVLGARPQSTTSGSLVTVTTFAQSAGSTRHQATHPTRQPSSGLTAEYPTVLLALLVAALLGFIFGRWRAKHASSLGPFGAWRFPRFQNTGEGRVSQLLSSTFRHPDYHLMNHVTIPMETGTTQVDHILLSRFGVFVIETKDFNGWIFGQATDAMWTSVYFRRKVKFQNPIHQNYRHLCAVRELLAFVPPDSIKSLVVFTGSAEFKTEMPPGVLDISELVDSIRLHTERIMSPNRLQFCVGRLETTRLAITATTDVEHVESLNQRFRERAV